MDSQIDVRRPEVLAGALLLVMAVLAGFGNLVAVQGLVTPGDAARTTEDVAASLGLFRLGVLSLHVVVVLDVVVAWALMRVFSHVDRHLSRLAAWFRLAYAGAFLVAVSQLAGIPRLVHAPAYASSFGRQQVLLKVDTFDDIWSAALILFGVHLILVGALAFRSEVVPTVLGVLLVVAGAGYLFDSAVSVLVDEPAFEVSSVTFVGEFLLALWLVFRGHRFAPAEKDLASTAA